ncbi:MAG: hypothetical protein IPO66_20725 [Rhodanobacteraceae bacterium]|nr:hypothetical protein [Rhodanobacteraceae bacterium]
MSSTRFSQPYAYGPRNFRLAAGQLLLFPSWVMHEVRPYFGEASRITVAFNVRFRMAGVKRGQVPIYRADQ